MHLLEMVNVLTYKSSFQIAFAGLTAYALATSDFKKSFVRW